MKKPRLVKALNPEQAFYLCTALLGSTRNVYKYTQGLLGVRVNKWIHRYLWHYRHMAQCDTCWKWKEGDEFDWPQKHKWPPYTCVLCEIRNNGVIL